MKLQGKVAIVTGAASGFGGSHRPPVRGETGPGSPSPTSRRRRPRRWRAPIGEDKAIAVRTDVSSRADIDALLAETTRGSARRTSSSTTPATPTATGR